MARRGREDRGGDTEEKLDLVGIQIINTNKRKSKVTCRYEVKDWSQLTGTHQYSPVISSSVSRSVDRG